MYNNPTEGSSPLARGLLDSKMTDLNKTRIIPARAGFTLSPFPILAASQDHPRSRGVYGCFSVWTDLPMGSSPLARGLHDVANTRFGKFGIIPARAGFTSAQPPAWRRPRDHPRSRGVYSPTGSVRTLGSGSSPLARGLPRGYMNDMMDVRIIPARAGFTRLLQGRSRNYWDHPRSRGVYTFASMTLGR